ncbi:MAG: PilN domain-containing protein [Candidatus Omnitrophota bacterium]|nr:MAG: PilN domain-containing protein [Candidatus Omnitrophota bacterium]
MRSKITLILEVGEKTIKACRVASRKRRRKIKAVDVFQFPHRISAQDINDVFLKITNKVKYEKVIVSFPRHFFLIRFLKLPSSNWSEVKKMLPLQISKGVIQPLEDVVYDYALADVKGGYSKVVLFLTQQKKIANLLDFIKQSKVAPSFITISSWGLYQWIRFISRFLKQKIKEPFVIVDVSDTSAEFLVVGKEGIIFSRAFPYLKEEELKEGINQSLKIFEKEFGGLAFGKVIFTGCRKEEIIKSIDWAQALFIGQLDNFYLDKTVRGKINASGLSFASVLGLVVGTEPAFDFSPQFLKEKRQHLKRRRRYVKVVALILEIILILGIFTGKYLFDRYAYLNFLNSKLQEVKIEVKELGAVVDKLKILDRELAKSVGFSEVIYDLVSAIPQNTQLSLVDFRDKGDFSIKGYAQNNSEVFAIKKSLSESELFEDVKIKYSSKVKGRKRAEVFEFYIEGRKRR